MHPDREQSNKVIEIDLGSLAQKTILDIEGKRFGGLSISPSGKKIATVMSSPNLLSYGQLCLFNSDGSGFKEINFDRVPNNIEWANDEKTILLTASSNGGIPFLN